MISAAICRSSRACSSSAATRCRTFEALGCIVEEAYAGLSDASKSGRPGATLRAWQAGIGAQGFYADPAKRAADEARSAVRGRERPRSFRPIDVRDRRRRAHRVVPGGAPFSSATTISCCRARRCSRSTPTPTGRRNRRQDMDTYHRWMEVMIPVTMSGCPAIGCAGRLQRARPADGNADRRSDAIGAVVAADRARLRPGDAVGDEGAAAGAEGSDGAVTRRPS